MPPTSTAPTAADATRAFGRAAGALTAREVEHLETARRYLAAIEARSAAAADPGGDAVAAFHAPDAVQEELPNRLVPAGARRDLAALREAADRGRAVLRAQRFEVRAAWGVAVALELLWVGTLAVPLGALAAGDEMRAWFAVFLEFRDGRIGRQRNYDCFEPF